MAFDDIFDHIGGMGYYQISLFLVIGFQCFYSGFQSMAMVFLGPDQDHWCAVDELVTLPYDNQKQVAIPHDADTSEYERCFYYDLDYESYSDEQFCQFTGHDENVTINTKECTTWVYDQTQYSKTAVSEYNLVCGREFLVGIVYSSYILAILVSAFVCGIASDYFGRKKIFALAVIFEVVFALISAFAPNYATFLIFRFLTAFCVTSGTACGFVILTEIVGPQYRAATGTIYWCTFAVGYMVLPGIAFFVTDFRYLQIVMACIMAVGLTFILLVPESPRWLVDKNKINDAIDLLTFIADVNNRKLPDDVENIIKSTLDPNIKLNEEKTLMNKDIGKWRLLCTNSALLKTILILVPAWVASSLVYNGLAFNIGQLSGNLYVNVFISGSMEIPANMLAWFLIYAIGRRRTQTLSLVVAGGFCLLCVPFVDENGSSVVTGLALVGKAFITISYTTVFLFTAEMFPTPVRHISHGICNTCGNLAGMIAPFMGAPLMDIWLPLPLVIFGLVGIITGPLILLLPETSGLDLPDTIEEAEAMWRKKNAVDPSKNVYETETSKL